MTDKYKIYVPEEMKARLINDAELFDFTKKMKQSTLTPS